MNIYRCIIVSISVTVAYCQKYKVIYLPRLGLVNLTDYGVTPNDNKLIFELEGCSTEDYVGFLASETDTMDKVKYRFMFETDSQGTLSVHLFFLKDEQKAVETYTHGKCSTFIRLKLEWRNWNFAVWIYHVTGWKKILNWAHVTPNLPEVQKVVIQNDGHAIRIFAIDHTTTPHRSTCVKLLP